MVDAAHDYAQHIPVRVIANMLGLPPGGRGPSSVSSSRTCSKAIDLPPDDRQERVARLFDYLLDQVHKHLDEPQDDLTTLPDQREAPRESSPRRTSSPARWPCCSSPASTRGWSAIGASLWHLAKTPADRERLVAEPGLLTTAMEEFLRAYAPVTMARLVKDDMHWHGVDMKSDDWILLSFPAANRDPVQFDRAAEVIIDREVNRHAAFGLGIHRCLGSHLARMELRVALEGGFERIPAFSLDDPGAVTWSAGQIRGPRSLPVRIG